MRVSLETIQKNVRISVTVYNRHNKLMIVHIVIIINDILSHLSIFDIYRKTCGFLYILSLDNLKAVVNVYNNCISKLAVRTGFEPVKLQPLRMR